MDSNQQWLPGRVTADTKEGRVPIHPLTKHFPNTAVAPPKRSSPSTVPRTRVEVEPRRLVVDHSGLRLRSVKSRQSTFNLHPRVVLWCGSNPPQAGPQCRGDAGLVERTHFRLTVTCEDRHVVIIIYAVNVSGVTVRESFMAGGDTGT